MSGEHEWYVSLMTTADMVAARKYIPGLSSDTRNPGVLREDLLQAFQRGFERGRKRLPRILIRDFYNKCAEENLPRYKDFLGESYESFLLHMQAHPKFRPYITIAIFYHKYPQAFEKYLEIMVDNKKNKKNLFDGIISSDLSDLEKINIVLKRRSTEFSEVAQEIEAYIQELWPKQWEENSNKKDLDDITFYSYLTSAASEQHWTATFFFLLGNNRFSNEKYNDLRMFVLQEYHAHRLKTLKRSMDEIKQFNQQLENNQSVKVQALQEVQHKNHLLISKLNEKEEEANVLKSQLLESQSQTSAAIIGQNKWELDKKIFYELRHLFAEKTIGKMMFLTDDENYFPAKILQSKIITSISQIKDCSLLWIDKAAFPSSIRFQEILKKLNEKHIPYVELLGYDPLDHIRQILNTLYQEEISHYADV